MYPRDLFRIVGRHAEACQAVSCPPGTAALAAGVR
jgi:hypothetical protein